MDPWIRIRTEMSRIRNTVSHNSLWLSGSPVALWDGGDGRLEAVGVVATVTAVAQQQRVLVLSAVAELNKGGKPYQRLLQKALTFSFFQFL
jgi:hypothetical protein